MSFEYPSLQPASAADTAAGSVSFSNDAPKRQSHRKKSTPKKRNEVSEESNIIVDHTTAFAPQNLRPLPQQNYYPSSPAVRIKTSPKKRAVPFLSMATNQRTVAGNKRKSLSSSSLSSSKKTNQRSSSRRHRTHVSRHIMAMTIREPKLKMSQSIPENEHFLGPLETGKKRGEYWVYRLVDDVWEDYFHYYRVRWWGWTPQDDTWELGENLTKELIAEYRQTLKRHGLKEDSR